MNRTQKRRAAARLSRPTSRNPLAGRAPQEGTTDGPNDRPALQRPRFSQPGRDDATRLCWPLLAVQPEAYRQCPQLINATPGSLGLPLLTQKQYAWLARGRYPYLDLRTRAIAKALASDPEVALACGVQPELLVLMADQRSALSVLDTTLASLGTEADQQVAVFDAAEKELTDQLYAYYVDQLRFGKLSASETQRLHKDFSELVRLRVKRQQKIRKIKRKNAKRRQQEES